MNTSFTHALRVLICPDCGESGQVDVDGGETACDACGSAREIASRVESSPAPDSLTTDERLQRLRTSDPVLPSMPEEVRLFTGDAGVMLAPEHAAKAKESWLSMLHDGGGDEEGRRMFFHLTMLLYRHTKSNKDDLQLRGILESAMEASSGHRDEQIFRCVLSRAAARAGDVTSAEDWLLACDTASGDLHAHGAYRYSAAYIATLKKQFKKVHDHVGIRVGDVPLGANLDVICSVLRANAHERLGDMEAASYELADCMGRVANGAEQVERVIRNSPDVVLCRNSFVEARRLHAELSSATDIRPPGARPSLMSALPWVVLSLFFLGFSVMTDATSTVGDGHRLDLLFMVLAITFFVPLLFVLLRRSR